MPATLAPPDARSQQRYAENVPRELTERQLRDRSEEIMRALDLGESFTIVRDGVVIGELRPAGPRRFVSSAALLEILESLPPVDADRLRADLDAVASQDPTPRA